MELLFKPGPNARYISKMNENAEFIVDTLSVDRFFVDGCDQIINQVARKYKNQQLSLDWVWGLA
ncbi:MAG: hypothetical protein NTX76_04980 [Alphaproteobacteria bacterium]|nr:hypothetical protein [Alphaproteobacteria bacterium]